MSAPIIPMNLAPYYYIAFINLTNQASQQLNPAADVLKIRPFFGVMASSGFQFLRSLIITSVISSSWVALPWKLSNASITAFWITLADSDTFLKIT